MNVIPTGIKDVDDATESLAEISKLLTRKEYGRFDKQNASNIASALWVYKNSQEPSSVINIANNFEAMNAPNYKGTSSDKNLLTAFNKIGNMTELLNVSKQAKQSLQNDANILKEQYEFGQGDTKIQSTFGMFSPQVVNEFKQQSQDADLSQLADEFETLEETQTNDLEYEGPSDLDKRLSDFNDLTDSIKEDRKELSRLKKLDRQGFEVDKDRLKSLASDIETAKKENHLWLE